MNYYEELGVSPTASLAEIQQAYRSLVRIIHPDHQQDARLRKLSELQLLRLNQIAHTLADPVKRGEYDGQLARGGGLVPAAVEVPRQEVARTPVMPVVRRTVNGPQLTSLLFLGLSAAVVGVGAFIWVSERYGAGAGPERAAVSRTTVSRTTVAQAVPAPVVISNAPERGAPVAERQVEIPRAEVSKVEVPKEVVAPKPEPAPVTAKKMAPKEAVVAKVVEAKPKKGLAGRWLSASRGDSDGLQTVEMQLALQDGQLRGKYYAKYRGAEAEGSPEVRFQFAGREGASLIPWSSSTGARGEVRIKPLSQDRVEVTWFTTVHGPDDRLVSGRAVLRRVS